MTPYNDNTNDDFGRFMVEVRDKSIEVIASLLDPARTDEYSVMIKKAYLDAHNNLENFSLNLLPAIVDEVITILLQSVDKKALNDRRIDVLYSNDLGEDMSDESVYKNTESLGLDYVDEWRRKYSKYNIIDVQ